MTNYRLLRAVLLLLMGSLLVTPSSALDHLGSVGGAFRSVAAKDGYVYLCEGRGLTVLDARADGDPVVIERVRLESATTSVRLDNEVAYVGTGDGKVRLYSLANPASPVLLGTITLSWGSITDVAFEENLGYFASGAGVEIVDVSNPAAPVAVSRYRSAYTQSRDSKRHVSVVGTRMYMTNGAACQEFDVSDPHKVALRANLTPPEGQFYSFNLYAGLVRRLGADLYVEWDIRLFNGLYLYPSDEIAVYRLGEGNLTRPVAWPELQVVSIQDMLVQGSSIYLLEDEGVVALDARDPQNVTMVSRLALPDPPHQGAVDRTGSRLAVLDRSGLTTIAIGQGDAMSVSGHTTPFPLGIPQTISISGGGCFAASDRELSLVSIDSLTTPTRSYNELIDSPFFSAAARGRFLYLSSQSRGLDVRYLTPEPTIARVASLDPLAWENVESPVYGGLALAGETVWLAYSTGKPGSREVGLLGFDASRPLHPTMLGRNERGSSARNMPTPWIAVSGTRACVAADKLYFFDIADPSSPEFLSEVQIANESGNSRIFWSGDCVVFLDDLSDFGLVDASDPANPLLIPSISELPSPSRLKCVENNRAYVAAYQYLLIYRLLPDGRQILSEINSFGADIASVEVNGGHVYTLDSEAGLVVMKTDFPDHRAQRHLLGSDTGTTDWNSDGVIDAADLMLAMAVARE